MGGQRKSLNLTVNKKIKNMKKTIAIVALVATLTSCGGSSTTTPSTTDSTTVTCDSTQAGCDSTKTDSTKTVEAVKETK